MSRNPQTPAKISGKFSAQVRPLVTPGIYTARIKEWKVAEVLFPQPKLIILCDVLIDGANVELAHFCNIAIDDKKQIKSPGRRSHLYKLVNALCPDTLDYDLDALIGLTCQVTVETSMLDEKKSLKPAREHYSKISVIKALPTNESHKHSIDEEFETV